MNRKELLAKFLMSMRNPAQKPRARSARRLAYKICQKCGEMMLEDSRGGIICSNCNSDTGIDFSGQHILRDVKR